MFSEAETFTRNLFSVVNRDGRQWAVEHIHAISSDLLWLSCRPYKLRSDLNRQPKRPGDLDLWPFCLESGVRVTCDVGYLCANFNLPMPLCSRVTPDVRDIQTDVRQHHHLMPTPTMIMVRIYGCSLHKTVRYAAVNFEGCNLPIGHMHGCWFSESPMASPLQGRIIYISSPLKVSVY